MFCHKCGVKVLDGAEFCQKCGAKLIIDAPAEQSVSTPPGSSTQRPNSAPMNTSGKKKSKLSIILGIVAALAFVLVVLAVIGSTSDSEPSKNDDADISSNPISNSPNEKETPTSTAPNDSAIRFKGVPLDDIFGAPYTDIFELFGQPDIWDDTWEYTNDVTFYTDAIDHLAVDRFSSMRPADFEYTGHTFDSSFDDLIRLLGDDYESLGAAGYQWVIGDYCFDFYIPRDTDRIESVDVSHIDTDIPINNDEYLGDDSAYYPNVDSSLNGRWRSDTGAYMELRNGYVQDINFRVWQVLDRNPDGVTWTTDNGRLTFSSRFDATYEYTITYGKMYSWDKDRDWLQFTQNGHRVMEPLERVEGNIGDGLIGKWSIGNSNLDFNTVVIYADGTGSMGGKNMSWYGDDTTFSYTYYQTSSYDYFVLGNVLTLYSSSGSTVYTKVGD